MIALWPQVFFLLILLNLLAGLALAREWLKERWAPWNLAFSWLDRGTPRLVLGLGVFFIGFLGLFLPLIGEIPVLGDLIPCVSGLLGGTSLVLGYYREKGQKEGRTALDAWLLDHQVWFGFGCLGAGTLHFLVPGWVFF